MSRVVFTFARMNPPTAGHQKLLNTMDTISGDHFVFLSHTHDSVSNPLCWAEKRNIINECFPDIVVPEDCAIRTPFQALEQLCKTYNDIVIVVGSDRLSAFSTSMSKYAKEWGASKFKVVSAGVRLDSSDNIAGVSASKARQFAVTGNYTKFKSQLPDKLSEESRRNIYNIIRERLSENKRNST